MGSDVGSLFTLEVSSVFPLEEWLRVSPVAWPYLYGLCASVVLLLRPISVSLDWMLGLMRLPEVPSLLCHCSAAEGVLLRLWIVQALSLSAVLVCLAGFSGNFRRGARRFLRLQC